MLPTNHVAGFQALHPALVAHLLALNVVLIVTVHLQKFSRLYCVYASCL
jgi:hypothetical protein